MTEVEGVGMTQVDLLGWVLVIAGIALIFWNAWYKYRALAPSPKTGESATRSVTDIVPDPKSLIDAGWAGAAIGLGLVVLGLMAAGVVGASIGVG